MLLARHHSHSKAPIIEETLQNAIADVRNDNSDKDWVLCGFDGGEDIRLIDTGTGGIEALKEKIVWWDVCYGLVRCTHTLEQAGYVQTDFVKFVWVYWRPDDIPVVRKMKIGVNEGEMKRLFSPYHAELQTDSLDGLGEGQLANVLDNVTMRADKTAPPPLPRSPSAQGLLQKGRKAWARARSSLPAIHFAQFAIADEQKRASESTELSFEDVGDFGRAIANIRSDKNPADWCLVGYKDKSTLTMAGSGSGGLGALLDRAEPFGVNYGLLRVSEKFDMVFHEAFCFITWMPESVPAFVKARVSTHQGAVASAFRQHVHCQFFFRGAEREDITLGIIRARIRQIIGSDGPRKYKKKASKKDLMATAPSPASADPEANPADTQAAPKPTEAEPAPEESHAALTEGSSSRPVYIAPKTRTKTLRGSIVVKADTIKTESSPSSEEKQHFPKVFLDKFTKTRARARAAAIVNSNGGHENRGDRAASIVGMTKKMDTSAETNSTTSTDSSYSARTSTATLDADVSAVTNSTADFSSIHTGTYVQEGRKTSRNGIPVAGATTRASTEASHGADTKVRQRYDELMITSVHEAVQMVRHGDGDVDFLVAEWWKGANAGMPLEDQLEIREVGSGGVQALADCLDARSTMYGLVRVTETKGGRDVEKICFVTWTPTKASSGPATQASVLQGEVARLFHPYHGKLNATQKRDVTAEAVAAKVCRLKQ